MVKKNTTLLSIILVLILIVIGIIAFSGNSNAEIIKVGVILPMSGPASSYGEGFKTGVDLAVDKVKSTYGEDAIEFIYEDSAMDPSLTTTVTQKLINVDGVQAIIIGSSSETLAAAPIAESNNVLLMTVGTSADITDVGDYVFRMYPSDLYQGNDLAQLMIDRGYSDVAVLSVQNDYGIGLTNVFTSKFTELGGNVVASENFLVEGVTDFKTQLNKIDSANPEAILIFAHDAHYPLILKQMKELNIDLPVFASETFQSQSILDEAGDLAEGVIFTNFVEPNTAAHNSYVALYKQEYDSEPFAFTAGFYDNVLLVSEGLVENSGDVDKTKDWLYDVNNYQGATGITNFDENGDVIGKSYTIMTVRNGEFVVA